MRKPIYLLADSQLLFFRDDKNQVLLERLKNEREESVLTAAYLGASNGDAPEFYELFVAAMAEIGVSECRMISSSPNVDDRQFLESAQIIMLAGGDVKRGWDNFKRHDLPDLLRERYNSGASFIGVSAGAIQLGQYGWTTPGDAHDAFQSFEALRIVPAIVSVHERTHWTQLRKMLKTYGEGCLGFGLEAGGGLIYHPDHYFEPVRQAVYELYWKEGRLCDSLLMPGEAAPSLSADLHTRSNDGYGPVLEPEVMLPVYNSDLKTLH